MANSGYVSPGTRRTAKEVSKRMRDLPPEDREQFEPGPGEPDTRTRSEVYADQLRVWLKQELKENPIEVFQGRPEEFGQQPSMSSIERKFPLPLVALGLLAVLAILLAIILL